MFSDQPHCHYHKSPLVEVICQLRFPQILTINANPPADFQDAIRSQFPKYSANASKPAVENQTQPPIINYQFSSLDGTWRVNLTSGFISLSTNAYTTWEEFAERLDGPLAAFIKIYKPACFERVGLRYMNFFSRERLCLVGTPFRDMFTAEYLGLMNEEKLPEESFSRSSVDADISLGNGCRVQIHAGPGLVKKSGTPSNEVHFILDNDFYMPGNIPVNYSAGALQTLHNKIFPVFRGAVTELLHNAMEPDEL